MASYHLYPDIGGEGLLSLVLGVQNGRLSASCLALPLCYSHRSLMEPRGPRPSSSAPTKGLPDPWQPLIPMGPSSLLSPAGPRAW